jgi:membrane-associated phospholipid phosphatase
VLALVLVAGHWRRVARRTAAAWTEIGHLAAFVFSAVALSGMAGNVLKAALGRSRPVLVESDGTLALAPLSFDYASLSFPSGHAITAAAAATALALVFRGRPGIVMAGALFALAVAASRVLVRAHFASDVVAGLFIGFAVTFLLAQAFGRRGIAFRHGADGRLAAKTVAIRRAFATRKGARRGAALRAAFAPPPPTAGACGKDPAMV